MANDIVIGKMTEEDFEQASYFVYEAMHLYTYLNEGDDPVALRKAYFLSMMEDVTYALGAYEDGKLIGFLCLEEEGKKPCFNIDRQIAEDYFARNKMRPETAAAVEAYHALNERMKEESHKHYDAEIILLAVHPCRKRQGIMRRIFEKLKQDLPGISSYLFTDSDCDVSYYPVNGFALEGKGKVSFPSKELTCYMFSKRL